MAQLTIQQAFDLASQHHEAGRLAEAEQLYRQILAREPEHADAMHNLGVIAYQVGRRDIAVGLIRGAIAHKPNFSEAHNNLGNLLRDNGRLDEAIAACRRAIALKPDYADAHFNLGNALKDRGQLDEAITAYRQAIVLNPNWPEAYSNLGNALKDSERLDDAVAAYRKALVLNPGFAEAHNNLGNALREKGQVDEAIAACRQAIALNSSAAEPRNNLGNALRDKGQLDEAIAAQRQAVRLDPAKARLNSNLVYTLHFHPAYDARAIAAENHRWNYQHVQPLETLVQPHSNDRDPDRRLRIGYVSPDFRDHCQSLFTIPLLSHHDHGAFEIFCYSSARQPDDFTARITGYADHWREARSLDDRALCDLIRADGIDILVDLTMHMADGRLPVFARKPAPVQVTWLAYPGSTGLTAIDYRLSDPYLDPPNLDPSSPHPPRLDESVYSEETIRLPDTFWCYDPLDCRNIPVNSLPALDSGRITFGCLNNFCKINDAVLALWAKVLGQVQGSGLLMLTHEGSHRQRTVDRLGQEGIAPERIEFVSPRPRRAYMELYHRIDIGLDSFPYNGHTTSLDSFWMGIPVVTLVGSRAVSRAGWCQLSKLGLTELAAQTADQFVSLAVDLANDLPRLGSLRETLRQRIEQSPLMDAPKFARSIESAYRRMWHDWCGKAWAQGRSQY